MKNLDGKTAIITGAGSGIGRALALELNREGCQVVLADIDPGSLEETRSLLNGSAQVAVLDVSNRKQVEAFANKILRDTKIDILINNAGVASFGGITKVKYETFEWLMSINFWGAVYMTKSFLPHLLARPQSHLVNVSSAFGLVGIPNQVAYCSSKFALRGFTESLRQECRGTPLAVTLVFPGGIRTNIARSARSDVKMKKMEREENVQRFEGLLNIPPEKAAQVILQGIKRNAPRVLVGSGARMMDLLARIFPATYDAVIAARNPFQ